MARTSNNIEYIKDKSNRAYIKANSIATDDNESLQDVLEKPKLYMVSGSYVQAMGGADSVIMHTWSQIQNMFNSKFGFTPTDKNALGITFTNGDAVQSVHINGSTWDGNNLYAVYDRTVSGSTRINYAYFYNH